MHIITKDFHLGVETIYVNSPQRTSIVLKKKTFFMQLQNGKASVMTEQLWQQSICQSMSVLQRFLLGVNICTCVLGIFFLFHPSFNTELFRAKKWTQNHRIKWLAVSVVLTATVIMPQHFQEHYSFETHWPRSIMHWFMWCYQRAAVRMGLFQMEGYGRINVLNKSGTD